MKGEGNSLDFGARVYDSRLGKWLSVDPLVSKYPGETPYNFTGNNPVIYIDPDGAERIISYIINNKKTGEKLQISLVVSDDIKAKVKETASYSTCNHCGYKTKYSYTEYEWFDINETHNITINEDGSRSETVTESLGMEVKTTTKRNWKWWAKIKIGEGYLNEPVGDKKYSSRGGRILYSKYGKNGANTVSTSMDVDMLDVGGLISMLSAGAANSVDKKVLIKKLGQLVSSSVESKAEKGAEYIGKLKGALGLNDETSSDDVDPLYLRSDDYGIGPQREKKGSLQDHKYFLDTIISRKPGKTDKDPDTIIIRQKN